MMKTSIADFLRSFHNPEIIFLEVHLPHVKVQGTNNCGNIHNGSFKDRIENKDVLCCHDYDKNERVVVSFVHQIQSD